jgi:beta-lactamase regulating signal transducer with metallopeptidase domain
MLGSALFMGLMLGVTVPLIRFLWAYRNGRRSLSAMLALGEPDHGYFRLKVPQPLAFTMGILRPQVCLSEGLLNTLPPQHLAVVLAHEKAHQRRLDGLRLLLAEATTLIMPPQFRAQLLGDLLQTTEQACDEGASHHMGDSLVVAEALLAASRLHLGAWPGLWHSLPAFGGGHLRPRVDALLNPAPAFHAWWAGARILPIAVLFLGLLAALSGEVHHALESLLGLLSH